MNRDKMHDNKEDAQACQDMFFYSGVRCRNGHDSERYASSGRCLECSQKSYLEQGSSYKKKIEPNRPALFKLERRRDEQELRRLESKQQEYREE